MKEWTLPSGVKLRSSGSTIEVSFHTQSTTGNRWIVLAENKNEVLDLIAALQRLAVV